MGVWCVQELADGWSVGLLVKGYVFILQNTNSRFEGEADNMFSDTYGIQWWTRVHVVMVTSAYVLSVIVSCC